MLNFDSISFSALKQLFNFPFSSIIIAEYLCQIVPFFIIFHFLIFILFFKFIFLLNIFFTYKYDKINLASPTP
jgi:hypothetical protein